MLPICIFRVLCINYFQIKYLSMRVLYMDWQRKFSEEKLMFRLVVDIMLCNQYSLNNSNTSASTISSIGNGNIFFIENTGWLSNTYTHFYRSLTFQTKKRISFYVKLTFQPPVFVVFNVPGSRRNFLGLSVRAWSKYW